MNLIKIQSDFLYRIPNVTFSVVYEFGLLELQDKNTLADEDESDKEEVDVISVSCGLS